jgi:hypothetical protein
MTEDILKLYLPGFIVVFIWIAFFWRSFRKLSGIYKNFSAEYKIHYNRFERINMLYRGILIIFFIMITVFAFIPKLYKWFFPIDQLNHPAINITGFLILKIALVWIVVAQIILDKEIHKYSRDIESLAAMEMVYSTERVFLRGLIVMFVGMFVTLSNVISFILVLFSLVVYFKPLLLKHVNNASDFRG